MKCPKCKTNTLQEKIFKNGQLYLDRCSGCSGIWFDKGELNQVLKKDANATIKVPKISLQNTDCRCPVCCEPMYEFCYPKTMVLIDMCKPCEGIWLDNKEWTEIDTVHIALNKIVCPKCKTQQDKNLSCNACGIIYSKYKESPTNEAKTNQEEDRPYSYADDITGIKGSLLRFIDRAINNLTNY